MDNYTIVARIPTVEEYCTLRAAVGWHNLSGEQTQQALRNSVYAVCGLMHGAVVGCGRVVGDGHIYYYLQDVIVHPAHQGKGVGKRMTQTLVDHVYGVAANGAFFGLMAAPNVASFYEQFGFQKRAEDTPGMSVWIQHNLAR
jgi:ribosomal protein S18 acetylase RimI-like enzyme